MRNYLLTSLIILFWTAEARLDADEANKIWSKCDANNSCSCGKDVSKAVRCTDTADLLWVQPCYCMYYDQKENMSIAGTCLFTCYHNTISDTGSVYYPIQRYSVQNASMFNDAVCNITADLNREGRFCGRCKQDFGLAVYSYNYINCIPCKEYGYRNWLKFFAIAFLPLTLFYILVICLKLTVTSSHLSGVVFVIQCVMSPIEIRFVTGYIYSDIKKKIITSSKASILKMGLIFFDMFNLNFFHAVFPDVCLHPRFTILHVVSLDLLVALYPFALIFLTYILIKMYDSNYRLLVWAWKPFKWLLQRYYSQFQVQTSLIETFATFIILSSVKILGVSFDILLTSLAYSEEGKTLPTRYLYYDGSIESLSREHIPFAVLALCSGFLFVVLPFIFLLLYPCRCFQRFLNVFSCKCQTLHIFMDAFQGSYKTEPYDMRYFSAYYIFLRILRFVIICSTQSLFIFPLYSIVMVLGALIFAVFQPYKTSSHNKSDVVLMLLAGYLYMTATTDIIASSIDYHSLTTAQILETSSILLFYSVCTTMLVWRTQLPKNVWRRCVVIYKQRRRNRQELYETLDTSDRLEKESENSQLVNW